MILTDLYPLFEGQSLLNVTDNASGAVCRMMMRRPDAVPLDQVRIERNRSSSSSFRSIDCSRYSEAATRLIFCCFEILGNITGIAGLTERVTVEEGLRRE